MSWRIQMLLNKQCLKIGIARRSCTYLAQQYHVNQHSKSTKSSRTWVWNFMNYCESGIYPDLPLDDSCPWLVFDCSPNSDLCLSWYFGWTWHAQCSWTSAAGCWVCQIKYNIQVQWSSVVKKLLFKTWYNSTAHTLNDFSFFGSRQKCLISTSRLLQM